MTLYLPPVVLLPLPPCRMSRSPTSSRWASRQRKAARHSAKRFVPSPLLPTPYHSRILLRQGGDVTRAIDWVFNHSDDPGEEVNAVVAPAAAKALPGSAKLPASYRLKAFISHKGPSPHSGHYVAHVWEGEERGWVLFNDEKVVSAEVGAQSAEALKAQAHVYVFEKI